MTITLNDKIKEFISYCDSNNIEIYLVGGALRDILLNENSYDYDFALTSDYFNALEVIKKKYKCSNDNKYQCIKLKVGEYNIEISHARIENNYIDYRHPSTIEFTNDIKLDSQRRDFTINALYYKDDKIYDFYNGLEHLKRKELVVVGDTLTRFKEDPLRILRMIRFAHKGFSISNIDKEIIIKNRYLLKELSLASFNKEFDLILNMSDIEIMNTYRVLFEDYFDTRFNNIYILKEFKNLEMKKTYLNIKNKSNYYKYKDIQISSNIIEINKLIYKYGKEIIKDLIEYYDIINSSNLVNIYNEIIDTKFHDKKQLNITSKDIIELTNKVELTSYYIDKVCYGIIEGKIKNNKEEIKRYIMENM